MNLYTKILAIIGDGEMTGLRVIELAAGTVNPRLHQGNVYPALRALVANGTLIAREAEGPAVRGGRPRYYYKRAIKPRGNA